MEKRALIAVVVSVLILVLYQEVVLRRFYPPARPEERVAEIPTLAPAEPGKAEKEAAELPAEAPAQPAIEERRIAVDTDLYTATFTTNGARLESFQLKHYRSTVDPNSPLQEMVVPSQKGELPFGIELRGGSAPVFSDTNLPYTSDGGRLDLRGDAAGTLEFVAERDGVKLSKRFTFRGDHYEFAATVGLHDVPSRYSEVGVSWFKTVELPAQPGTEVVFDKVSFVDGRKLIENPFDALRDGKVVTGEVLWAGYAGRHFLSAVVPGEARKQRLWLKLRDHTVEQTLLFPISGSSVEIPVDVYIGPKDFEALERAGHGLSRAVDLGWFAFIALPLLHVLNFFNGYTHNYGVDIILLTVLIKVLFTPITQRSFRSMREIQKLQPQMTKIREKFKDNQEEMNKEIMELYRRHKVNPLGGCLPMLVQMPVFIGLYSALSHAVELRHAPFMMWINDLSAPDRLGSIQLPFVQHAGIPVLTLLMGGTMFLQQWMTPTAGDPAQQRAMMIMPLMFTFMFVNLPSGLVLYWLVNNILTIAQQYYINRSTT